jgi:hypothetical protein
MVKQIKLYKMEFYKNDDANGGAMRDAIKNRKHGTVIIHTQSKKNGRAWGDATPEKLLALCEKNCGIYEVITDFPHKAYFDIDAPIEHVLTTEQQAEHLAAKLEIISRFFPNADYAVSGSYTDTKISYHIILNTYIIDSEETRIAMKAIVKHICNKIDKDFDWKVYTKNRNMKAINQSKDDGRVQQIISGDDQKQHFITCFLPTHPLPFPEWEPEINEAIMQEKARGKFNVLSLPKMSKPTPESFILSQASPTEIMNMLPCSKSHDHAYTHRIARFAYFNDVCFTDYLVWLSQKHTPITSEIANKWKCHWNQMEKYPKLTPEMMRPILFYYYPDMKKNFRLREFYGMFHIPESIEKITIDRLDQTHYSKTHPITILHLPMGSGKTAQTIDFLKTSPSFIWIGHRKSLHHGTLTRIKDADITAVDYLSGNSKTKGALYGNAQNLSICVSSMHHIPITKEFDTVVMDEIESLLDNFYGDFMQRKSENVATLCRLLRSAKKIVLIDAFITTKTIKFITAVCPGVAMQIIEAQVKSKRIINFINTAKDSEDTDCQEDFHKANVDQYQAIDEIAKEIISGKRVVIFQPVKKNMQNVEDTIKTLVKKATGREINVISYHADKGDEIKQTLLDVNKHWADKDVVMFNSTITCGVNFDLNGFDSCWCFMAHFSRPRDIIQATARVRNLASETINVVFLGPLFNTPTYQNDTSIVGIPEYNIIYDNFILEDMAPKRKALEVFCSKAGYKMKKSKHILNLEICKEIEAIFLDTDCSNPYTSIDLIDHNVAEHLQDCVLSQTATMYDKLCLKKFFWRLKFRAHDEDALAEIWDGGYTEWFQIYNKCIDTDSVFCDIQALNKWDSIIPPENYKTVILDKPTIAKIFTLHTFRTLTPTSNRDLIFKSIINTAFNTTIVESKEGHHGFTWQLAESYKHFKPALDAMLPHFVYIDPRDGVVSI